MFKLSYMLVNRANLTNVRRCQLTVNSRKCNFLPSEKNSILRKQLQKAIQPKSQGNDQNLIIFSMGLLKEDLIASSHGHPIDYLETLET